MFKSLFLLFFIFPDPIFSLTKNDSVVTENKTRKINGHTFVFRKTQYYEGELGTLRIFEAKGTDTVLVLERDYLSDGGDCNGRFQTVCEYELKRDSLFFYVCERVVDAWSFDNISSTSSTHKETYVIQKSGKFVRVRMEYGKKNAKLDEEIRLRLSKEISKLRF